MVKGKKGFTLVEMIAVIIIIGILAIITAPAVSRYINNTRNKTYEAYEENMKVAANNRLTACISENDESCLIPDKGEKVVYYMNDLLEKGFIDELKDPETDGFCDDILSYVEVKNEGNSNYTYHPCLYCSNYATDSEVCTSYEADSEKPECGQVIGESTKWASEPRTITVKCSDKSTGCTMNEFTKTFKDAIDVGYIEIADKSGNVQQCPVNVYLDKTKPTCELEISGGKLEATGWYSGDVTVKLKNPADGESGVLTYGIGTSINDKDYRRQTEIALKQGYTTVFGYVKDKAGNEGMCTLDVKIGAPQPEFDIEYGYQIYPNKESYTLQDMTESGTKLTSTSNDPGILFTGLENYRNVNRIVVHLNTAVTKTNEQAQVFYSNGTHTEEQSTRIILPTNKTKFEIAIPVGTYSNIRIDLGETSGDSYDIAKMELMVGERSVLYTNKDVSINVRPKNEKIRTTEYSFDGGTTWQTESSKVFTENYSNKVVTKNIATLISEPQNVVISNIDKQNPTCVLGVTSGSQAPKGYYYTDVTVGFTTAKDDGVSNVHSYGIDDLTTKTKTLTTDKTQSYTGNIKDKAGNTATCTISVQKLTNYTLTYDSNGGNSCSPTTKTVTYNSPYGALCVPTRTGYTFTGWYTDKNEGTQVTESTTVTNVDDHTIYAHWSANTYTVSFNANGGSTPTSSKPVTYDGKYGTLPTPTRSDYNFLGWYTAAEGGTQVTESTTVKITSDQTLYAHWEKSATCTKVYFSDYPHWCCASYEGGGCYGGCFIDGRPAEYNGMYEGLTGEGGGKCGYCIKTEYEYYNIVKKWTWKMDSSASSFRKKFYACYYIEADGTPTDTSCSC